MLCLIPWVEAKRKRRESEAEKEAEVKILNYKKDNSESLAEGPYTDKMSDPNTVI